jgi:ribosome maturation factor RimP
MADTITGAGERLWHVLEPYLAAEGVELDDLDVRGGGRGRMVRVLVDHPDGLKVDRIAELSRGLSRLLDEQDPVNGSYTLEVSSPGLERKLRRPRHFEKAIGREVDIKASPEIDGTGRHRGMLVKVLDGEVVISIEGTERVIPMASITQAKTVFRWEKAPKPGGKRGKR